MYKFVYLITISLDTPLYFTDGSHTVEHDGNTYIAGVAKVSSGVTQKGTPSTSDFTVALSSVNNSFLSQFLNEKYKTKEVIIEKAYLNQDGSISSVSGWMRGKMDSFEHVTSNNVSVLNITVASIFAAFQAVGSVNLGVKYADHINLDEKKYFGRSAFADVGDGGGDPGWDDPPQEEK